MDAGPSANINSTAVLQEVVQATTGISPHLSEVIQTGMHKALTAITAEDDGTNPTLRCLFLEFAETMETIIGSSAPSSSTQKKIGDFIVATAHQLHVKKVQKQLSEKDIAKYAVQLGTMMFDSDSSSEQRTLFY